MYLLFTRMPEESVQDLWWSLCILYLHPCHIRVTVQEDVPLVEYLVFTRMPDESYRTRGCTSGGVYIPCI